MPVDISEYEVIARDARNNSIPTGAEPARATHQVVPSGSSAASAAFGDTTRLVRIHTDTAVRFAFGADPTASAASPRLAPGSTEYFGVAPGHKIAVITTT